MAESFRCTIVTPEQPVLDEQVRYANVPAWDGQVGVASRRAPLLAKLGYGLLTLEYADGRREERYVGGGFMQMRGDVLTLLTDETHELGAVDAEEAEAALKEANAVRPLSEEQTERRDRDLARARGLLRAAERARR